MGTVVPTPKELTPQDALRYVYCLCFSPRVVIKVLRSQFRVYLGERNARLGLGHHAIRFLGRVYANSSLYDMVATLFDSFIDLTTTHSSLSHRKSN